MHFPHFESLRSKSNPDARTESGLGEKLFASLEGVMSDLNGVIGTVRCGAGKGCRLCLIGQPCVHIFLWRRNTNCFTVFVGTERRRESQNLTLMSLNHTLAFDPHPGFLGSEDAPRYQEPFDTCQVRRIVRCV